MWVQNAVLGCNLKNNRMISVCFQGKPFNITVIQAYAPTSNAKEAEVEWFFKDLQDLLELPLPKRCPFYNRKSRNTWSNRQIWPCSTEWSRAKANRILPREHAGHSKHLLPTTQQKTLHMDITRWSLLKPDWLYYLQPKMEKLYTVSKNKTRSWLWLRSWIPYCQVQFKLKTVRKTTRPFRYDLNQIPYDYTVEVRNRFKGLDLIECLRNYGCDTVKRQWSRPSPRKRNAKRQNGCLRRPHK